jgi:hypothetical protein
MPDEPSSSKTVTPLDRLRAGRLRDGPCLPPPTTEDLIEAERIIGEAELYRDGFGELIEEVKSLD